MKHLTMSELEAGLAEIRQSPRDEGVLELIVRRPNVDVREVLNEGELDLEDGLIGDSWKHRGSSRTPDGKSHPETQLNIMNSRVAALVAQDRERWQLAGRSALPGPGPGCRKLAPRYSTIARLRCD